MATERNDLEKYFEWWLNELKDHGYINWWDRESEVIPLFPKYVARRMKYFATKEPETEEFNLLQSLSYTYDYRVAWNPMSEHIFYQRADFKDPGKLELFHYRDIYFNAHWNKEHLMDISYVDVKPPLVQGAGGGGFQNNSYHTFPLKKQIILWMHGLYINKVVPFPMRGSGKTISLFPNTFTPHRFLITDGGLANRKIRFPIYSMKEYIKRRKDDIAEKEAIMKKFYDSKSTRKDKDLFDGKT